MAKIGNVDVTKIDIKLNIFAPGDWYEDEANRRFRYVRYYTGTGTVTAVAGLFVVGCDSASDAWDVTADGDSATPKALLSRPVGQLQSAPANAQYCWVQFYGPNIQAFTTVASGVAQDEILIPSTGDGTIDGVAGMANVTDGYIGAALEDDSSNTLAAGSAFLNCSP
jgi:hypothetical protein